MADDTHRALQVLQWVGLRLFLVGGGGAVSQQHGRHTNSLKVFAHLHAFKRRGEEPVRARSLLKCGIAGQRSKNRAAYQYPPPGQTSTAAPFGCGAG